MIYHDTDDYKKMASVIKFIQGTTGLPLILRIDKYVNIKWYIDAEFAVHKDMRIHTGGFMIMVSGGDYVKSRKQKFNTKSSNEADIFNVHDVLTQVVCTRYFLKEQGYEIQDNVIYQDILIVMKLENICR